LNESTQRKAKVQDDTPVDSAAVAAAENESESAEGDPPPGQGLMANVSGPETRKPRSKNAGKVTGNIPPLPMAGGAGG
jgi:hypothetical protein